VWYLHAKQQKENSMKISEQEKNQKAWVKKNLRKGEPATVSFDGEKITYGILCREFGNPAFMWRSGMDGLGLVAVSREYANKCKIRAY
jgi:hypothetical protein